MKGVTFRQENFEFHYSLKTSANIGTSSDVEIRLTGKNLRPLHAQILKEGESLLLRDFTKDGVRLPLEPSSQFVGDWILSSEHLLEFWNRVKPAAHQKFRDHLVKSEALEIAVRAVSESFFCGGTLPEIIKKDLEAQFSEISLEGPVEVLLKNEGVDDILVNAFDQIWVEIEGQIQKASFQFSSKESYDLYLQNLLSQAHLTLDQSSPFLDFKIGENVRGHLIVPPCTTGNSYLSLRKKRKAAWNLDELRRMGVLSTAQQEIVLKALCERRNILISGSTGSGKTTFLRALLMCLPTNERTLVMEDLPELENSHDHCVYLVSRSQEKSGFPEITLKELVRQALRMRPDRLVMGELRGPEALDFLYALNTGHSGSLGCVHANSSRDALDRLVGLAGTSAFSPEESWVRSLVRRNIHLLIHVSRSSEGKRRLSEMGWMRGLEGLCFVLEEIP